MMRAELEERVGKLEDWQWEMAHYVYQNDDHILDVGGKDQIAAIVKQGFGYQAPIRTMYKEANGPPIIVKTQHELLTTYDVTYESYCINERGNPLREIYEAIDKELKASHPELMENLEYFSDAESRGKVWDPTIQRITVFYVRGGSEGYYVHVDTRKEGIAQYVFLLKTLLEGEAGIAWAEQMVCALSRILKV